jgi:hypothetical protein
MRFDQLRMTVGTVVTKMLLAINSMWSTIDQPNRLGGYTFHAEWRSCCVGGSHHMHICQSCHRAG